MLLTYQGLSRIKRRHFPEILWLVLMKFFSASCGDEVVGENSFVE